MSARLDRALGTKDDGEFLQRLAEIDPRFNVVELRDRPEPLAMFGGLWILHLDVQLDGIWKYLAQSEGETFPQALRWCRDIGAKRALAYLRAVQRLFPGGRVPSDAADRYDVIEKLESKAIKTGNPKPLRALDGKYRAVVMPELAQRLRAWLRTNRAKVTRDLAAAAPPPQAPFDVAAFANAAAALDEVASREQQTHEARVALLRAAASKAGLIPWTSKADDAMLTRFIASVSALTRRQWTTVAQRYHRSQVRVQRALEHGFALTQQLRSGQLGDARAYQQRHARHTEALKALFKLTDALPQQTVAAGKKVGVRFGAHHAAAAAALAVRLHEWLMLTPEGTAHARNAYAPFAALAWTPTGRIDDTRWAVSRTVRPMCSASPRTTASSLNERQCCRPGP